MQQDQLVQRFEAYAGWRATLAERIAAYRDWLDDNELNDAQTALRVASLLARLNEDKLSVAFAAEFSRGKSELINAIFFAEYGQRLLPSSAGRTTMCPTELMYDAGRPIGIELLPIETRERHASTSEFKNYPDEWISIAFDPGKPDSMRAAFRNVIATRSASVDEARRLGLYDDSDPDQALAIKEDGNIDIPCWRHALINFPHPLLKQGLVILDTPGLNAIGAEPELTLNLLPNAHAVLFILAADTGVTKSDIEVWRRHIGGGGGRQKGRLVVLNKIDGLWDQLRSEAEIQAEIARQAADSAELLGVPPNQVFPISAQKGLLAKISRDPALLEKSRLPALERALSEELIPAKQEIVRDACKGELDNLMRSAHAILDARRKNLHDQLLELNELRGKNRDVVGSMIARIRNEKEAFERGLKQFQAARSVFSQMTNELLAHLGMDALKTEVKATRKRMLECMFSSGMREAMAEFFAGVKKDYNESSAQIAEISAMMDAMYRRFQNDHGLKLGKPVEFSVLRYQKEIEKLEARFHDHFDTVLNLIRHGQISLTLKFFETIASQVKKTYEYANLEAEQWLRAVMAPVEAQVREHQMQLRRRVESIRRIHEATETLEDRIAELDQVGTGLDAQIAELSRHALAVGSALRSSPAPAASAGALERA
jgi:dynamin family protein